MCYTVEYLETRSAKYAERYKEILSPEAVSQVPQQLPLFYLISGFAHPVLPIVKQDGIFMFEWGLIPEWVKDHQSAVEMQNRTLNAVGETVFDKPSFRKSIVTKRCLLGVNGFYEWQEYKKSKYPYLIQIKSEEIFSLGCIYETWVDQSTGEIRNTFSLVTTPANPLMEKIHNLKKRMPLIIAKSDEAKWIDPSLTREEIEKLIKPYPEEDMQAFTVSKLANNVRNERNVPEIIEKVEYEELEGVS